MKTIKQHKEQQRRDLLTRLDARSGSRCQTCNTILDRWFVIDPRGVFCSISCIRPRKVRGPKLPKQSPPLHHR